MEIKLAEQITHKGITAGFALVNGWQIDTTDIICDMPGASATRSFNNKRNYTVVLNGVFIGNIVSMSGGRFASISESRENIYSATGYDAELKCFIELIAAYYKG